MKRKNLAFVDLEKNKSLSHREKVIIKMWMNMAVKEERERLCKEILKEIKITYAQTDGDTFFPSDIGEIIEGIITEASKKNEV